MSSGLLKTFAMLASQGVFAKLRSHRVPYEVPGLFTALTGFRSADHGCFSYWHARNCGYRPRIITSKDLIKPFIWQRRELQGEKFALINLFGSHPPVPLHGQMITYPMMPTMRACSPDDLLWKLLQKGIRYNHDIYAWYRGQPREEFIKTVFDIEEARCAAAAELLREDTDVLIVNLTIADRFSHFYWQELKEGSRYKDNETAVFQAYHFLDSAINRLLDQIGSSANILVFSEIGFGPLLKYISVNEYLSQGGFLAQGADKQIEWEVTKAFESVQGTHGININATSFFERGCVTERDVAAVARDVRDYLKELINPYTGLRFFREVFLKKEVYDGEALDKSPDLILEPADPRYLPLGDPYWARYVNRNLQSGWHRSDGFLLAKGPRIASGGEDLQADLEDIAPTILNILMRDIPHEFIGSPLC